jgi:hypothetical protein
VEGKDNLANEVPRSVPTPESIKGLLSASLKAYKSGKAATKRKGRIRPGATAESKTAPSTVHDPGERPDKSINVVPDAGSGAGGKDIPVAAKETTARPPAKTKRASKAPKSGADWSSMAKSTMENLTSDLEAKFTKLANSSQETLDKIARVVQASLTTNLDKQVPDSASVSNSSSKSKRKRDRKKAAEGKEKDSKEASSKEEVKSPSPSADKDKEIVLTVPTQKYDPQDKQEGHVDGLSIRGKLRIRWRRVYFMLFAYTITALFCIWVANMEKVVERDYCFKLPFTSFVPCIPGYLAPRQRVPMFPKFLVNMICCFAYMFTTWVLMHCGPFYTTKLPVGQRIKELARREQVNEGLLATALTTFKASGRGPLDILTAQNAVKKAIASHYPDASPTSKAEQIAGISRILITENPMMDDMYESLGDYAAPAGGLLGYKRLANWVRNGVLPSGVTLDASA